MPTLCKSSECVKCDVEAVEQLFLSMHFGLELSYALNEKRRRTVW